MKVTGFKLGWFIESGEGWIEMKVMTFMDLEIERILVGVVGHLRLGINHETSERRKWSDKLGLEREDKAKIVGGERERERRSFVMNVRGRRKPLLFKKKKNLS